jgi:hypothetical protein
LRLAHVARCDAKLAFRSPQFRRHVVGRIAGTHFGAENSSFASTSRSFGYMRMIPVTLQRVIVVPGM